MEQTPSFRRQPAENASQAEHRVSSRRRTMKVGKIVFNQRSSLISCGIANLSDTGACLEVESSFGIPQVFELKFEPSGELRLCQVVWRNGRRIGVAFD